MGLIIGILIFIIIGILLARLARRVGAGTLKFSEMYNFFLKLFKQSGNK